MSPARSATTASSGSSSDIDSSTPGCGWAKRAIATGMIVPATDSNAAIRRRPPRRPAIASSSASASASRARIALGVAHDRLARVGEPHAARAALDEHGAGLALERGDLLGDGGLREGERVGGGGERAPEGDLAQDAHAADVEHQDNLYQPPSNVICADGPVVPHT